MEGGGKGKKREILETRRMLQGKVILCISVSNVSAFIRGANNLSLGAAVRLWGFNVQ